MKIFFSIILFLVFFASCKKDQYYKLTEDQKELSLYYAYNLGDTLKFLKNNTDTVLCTVTEKKTANACSVQTFSGCVYVEKLKIKFVSLSNKDFGSVESYANVNENQDEIGHIDYTIDNISVSSFVKNSIEMTVNNNIYTNAIELKGLNNDTMYINKTEGIIKAINNEITYTKIK